MTPRDVLRALRLPFTDPVLLIAGLVFWAIGAFGLLLQSLLSAVQPWVGLLGLLLVLAVMVPALTGYLVQLVDAGGRRQPPPVADSDLFLLTGSEWRVFPLLPVLLVLFPYGLLLPVSPFMALAVTLLLATTLWPAHFMLLAMTDSRWQSVNPVALARLVLRLSPSYAWCGIVAAFAAILLDLAGHFDNDAIELAVIIYLALAAAVFCGRLLATIDVAAESDIGAPREPDESERRAATQAERTRVLNHAYGLISRGNREGGFAHIDAFLDSDDDADRSALWFFNAMQRWDLGDAPLYYAQALLTRLLDSGDEAGAMKVMQGCLYLNERFRPLDTDRERLLAVAERLGNREIAEALRRLG